MARDDLILDRYEPIGCAGEGGFGTVQIAWDPRIQRRVAIKTIRLTALDAARAALPGAQAVAATACDDEPLPAIDDRGEQQVTALAHLPGLDEARTAAMMSDPRIVTVYDFEVRDRTAYLIMEFVEGITLTDLLADYADYLTLDIVAAVFDAVSGALMAAHESGVLHLDIKPDNILINTQGQVKVTDFGLATLADASGAGRTGGGTIGYMPPEQIRRESLDARADEWALASVTYEMLTGSNPFRVENLADADAAIASAELVVPSLCWKDIDDQIDDVVFYALDPDREERYQSVADFAEEVQKFLGDPDLGVQQLQLVVEDALGLRQDEEADAVPDQADVAGSQPTPLRRSLTERLVDALAPLPEDEAEEERETEADATGPEQPRRGHEPLSARVPEMAQIVLGHIFGAAASGFVGALAFTNMDPLVSAMGAGADYGIGVLIAIVAVLGAIRTHVGALVSFSLLGVALVMCGHPIAGAVLLVATVAWWYSVGHGGAAAANVAMLLPLAGAFGGSSMVPLFAGASLRPVRAIATTAFALVVAVILAGFGTGSLLDWNVLTYGGFARINVTQTIATMLKQPSTWATAGGWLAAAAVLSLMRLKESRFLSALGIILALAAVLVGSLAFASPSPQLIVSSILGAIILAAALV